MRIQMAWKTEAGCGYVAMVGAGYPLQDLPMGKSMAEARKSLVEINANRAKAGLPVFVWS